MVSTGVLVEGQEIRLGTLTFIADDSAWLQEAPLDVDALPVRGATHFRACVHGFLLRQPSTQYWSTPPSSTLPVSRQRKRSGRSRIQRWVRHAVARGPSESTRDYLTCWAELRNSCEGVHEVQAIEYFTAGCR